MTDTKQIGQTIFRLRGGIWTAFFLGILFMASPSGIRCLAGISLVLLGQGIRLWASGCIVRYRGEKLQAPRLTTWGPYSMVRNPLYLGNGFIGLGWSIMAGWKVLLLFLVLFYIIYDRLIIPAEESFLEDRFGEEYRNYRQRTGRFIPTHLPGKYHKGPFDRSILWKSESHSIIVTVLGTLLILSRIFW